MKNTPKVGLVSNFWGAVHFAGLFYFFLLTMSGVTASSTLTVVFTPYTTAEPAASAMASNVQPHNANAVNPAATINLNNFTATSIHG
ncbi:hypothetical protein [Limnohabitans sp. Jir72]|uniref:hypothetical protein n=1 Tax=Limnohabitans sp. Jir72 TaxID=1977909 RepID=UPI001304AEC5|nr:hypothetical protein [Limnohabitans sp. Jir72]